jgi:hypothetical protein
MEPQLKSSSAAMHAAAFVPKYAEEALREARRLPAAATALVTASPPAGGSGQRGGGDDAFGGGEGCRALEWWLRSLRLHSQVWYLHRGPQDTATATQCTPLT